MISFKYIFLILIISGLLTYIYQLKDFEINQKRYDQIYTIKSISDTKTVLKIKESLKDLKITNEEYCYILFYFVKNNLGKTTKLPSF